MNIENDYLWDKTGELDPEIQQLEAILGTLRHQPRTLEIPLSLQMGPERKFFRGFVPGLAIAAAIAMIVLGLGLWIGLQRLQRGQPGELAKTGVAPAMVKNLNPEAKRAPDGNQNNSSVVVLPTDHKPSEPTGRYRVNPSLLAGNTNQSRSVIRKKSVRASEVAMNELKEAEAGKDQLLLALRVACAKLSFAQRKTQESTNPQDLIHNQHKIG